MLIRLEILSWCSCREILLKIQAISCIRWRCFCDNTKSKLTEWESALMTNYMCARTCSVTQSLLLCNVQTETNIVKTRTTKRTKSLCSGLSSQNIFKIWCVSKGTCILRHSASCHTDKGIQTFTTHIWGLLLSQKHACIQTAHSCHDADTCSKTWPWLRIFFHCWDVFFMKWIMTSDFIYLYSLSVNQIVSVVVVTIWLMRACP